MILYAESSDSFVASAAASIAPGWRRTSSRARVAPAVVQRLSRRTVTSTTRLCDQTSGRAKNAESPDSAQGYRTCAKTATTLLLLTPYAVI